MASPPKRASLTCAKPLASVQEEAVFIMARARGAALAPLSAFGVHLPSCEGLRPRVEGLLHLPPRRRHRRAR
eukprot:8248793-Alexandrium_andersonii.AAC.1